MNITTPEWSIFGDRFQTQKNRERYLKKLGITKLISMIAFIILLFLTTRAFNQGSIILSIILLLLCLSLFIAGIGIPKKIVFLHLLRSLARLLVSCLMISAPYISLKRKISCILIFLRLLKLKPFGYLTIFIMETF